MSETTIVMAHAGEPMFRGHVPEWKNGRCSYCGSMTVAEATRLLTTPGTHFSGSDWKYGWPHKFYIEGGTRANSDNRKFYSAHLRDATPEEIEAFNAAARPTVGITFEMKDGELYYRTPHLGFQTWGEVPTPADPEAPNAD